MNEIIVRKKESTQGKWSPRFYSRTKLWQQDGSFLTPWDKKHQTTPKALNRKGSRDDPKFWFKTWLSLFCSTVASLQLESNKLWQKKTKRIFLFQQFSFHRRCCKSHMFSTPTVAPRLRFENHPIEWHCLNQIVFLGMSTIMLLLSGRWLS